MPKKVDQNQPEIVAALRQVGAAVLDIHEVGHGAPDLVVWYRGLHLLELKTKTGKLTPDEREWHTRWPGPIHIVRDYREALRAVGASWEE
jgi:hypothetical protein